jgi:hypothetical protein
MDDFFERPMYLVHVSGWPAGELTPEKPVEASGDARLQLWETDPADGRRIPPPGDEGVLFATQAFSMMNSGNRTLRAPKRSWKIDFAVQGSHERVAGMSRLNLKAMYNDPSQMREALAWHLFGRVGVPASRHTYARLAIDDDYRGLFSLIEQVDRRFLKDRFAGNDRGNLYKAYCGDIGCATLERRTGADGDDSGRQYARPGSDDQTYRLQTNEHDAAASTYDDLAHFIRTINGIGLDGGDARFATDAFRESVEGVMDTRAFLRWAGVDLLAGSWDNYFATPANYYLYNAGHPDAGGDFVARPYFTFIPWDYDNSFGIDYFGTRWQYTDIVDWPGNTYAYWGRTGKTSAIPLVTNLLRNHDLCQYYLDHLEHLLDTDFSPVAITTLMGTAGGSGLWDRISTAAYQESDTPYGEPTTGRQFTNDEVWRAGHEQNELRHGSAHIEGIVHYVRMRCDSAREQLASLRRTYPAGASGATFPRAVATSGARA